MLKAATIAILIVFGARSVCWAQEAATPGVSEPMPGVQVVDGAAVPALRFDAATLDAILKKEKSFPAAEKLLGGGGIVSPGPSGTTTHMYKILDTASGNQMVLILFVKGSKIVDYLLT